MPSYEELLGYKKKEDLHPPPEPLFPDISEGYYSKKIGLEALAALHPEVNEKDIKELIKIKAIPGYFRWVTHGDTKRSFYIAQVPDKSSRVTYEEMSNDLEDRHEKLQLVQRMPPEVLKELKEKIKGRKIE